MSRCQQPAARSLDAPFNVPLTPPGDEQHKKQRGLPGFSHYILSQITLVAIALITHLISTMSSNATTISVIETTDADPEQLRNLIDDFNASHRGLADAWAWAQTTDTAEDRARYIRLRDAGCKLQDSRNLLLTDLTRIGDERIEQAETYGRALNLQAVNEAHAILARNGGRSGLGI